MANSWMWNVEFTLRENVPFALGRAMELSREPFPR